MTESSTLPSHVRRISVIGNACTGKTTLSKKLGKKFNLPLVHIDSIQFMPGLVLRDQSETRRMLSEAASEGQWIIDGLGPLNILEKRLLRSELIICIKIPLWQTYWFAIKRQIMGLFFRRPELPLNCFESSFNQTRILFRSIWNVHHGLWPQLLPILENDIYRSKVIYVKKSIELNSISI